MSVSSSTWPIYKYYVKADYIIYNNYFDSITVKKKQRFDISLMTKKKNQNKRQKWFTQANFSFTQVLHALVIYWSIHLHTVCSRKPVLRLMIPCKTSLLSTKNTG